jgi:hypothetical protein
MIIISVSPPARLGPRADPTRPFSTLPFPVLINPCLSPRTLLRYGADPSLEGRDGGAWSAAAGRNNGHKRGLIRALLEVRGRDSRQGMMGDHGAKRRDPAFAT